MTSTILITLANKLLPGLNSFPKFWVQTNSSQFLRCCENTTSKTIELLLVWTLEPQFHSTKKFWSLTFLWLCVFSISTMDIYDVYRDLYAPLSSGHFGCNLLKALLQLQRSCSVYLKMWNMIGRLVTNNLFNKPFNFKQSVQLHPKQLPTIGSHFDTIFLYFSQSSSREVWFVSRPGGIYISIAASYFCTAAAATI